MTLDNLTKQDFPSALQVLINSFSEYEVMRYFFQDSGEHYNRDLSDFLSVFCEMSLLEDWFGYVLKDNDAVVAVAIGRNDFKGQTESTVEEGVMNDFYNRMSTNTKAYMDTYEYGSLEMHSPLPNHFIELIGVDPKYQGKGYSKALMSSLEELSKQDPISEGICLNTESATNERFYLHMGYELIAKKTLGDLQSRCFFKAT